MVVFIHTSLKRKTQMHQGTNSFSNYSYRPFGYILFHTHSRRWCFSSISDQESITFHSLTINFSYWKLYIGGMVLWITCRLFTVMAQWVHSCSLVTTGLGIKSHHNLCSGPGSVTNFTGNISRHFHYVLFSPLVKWIRIISAASQGSWDDWCFDNGEIWVDVTRQAQSVIIILYHQINPSV